MERKKYRNWIQSLRLIVPLALLLISVPATHSAKALASVPHLPISIIGNTGFTSANGTIAGNGSISNPFIIAGWNIVTTSTDGIHIEHTTASFIIQNVEIQGQSQSNGIFFFDVTNGTVDGVTITGSLDGITITLSNATVENSYIFANNDNGIKIVDGENIGVFNNTLTGETGAGIDSENCVRCDLNVTRNMITSNFSGIVLQSMNNSFIFENRISFNTKDGIGIYESRFVVVVLNNISYNVVGIKLGSSTNNLIHHNNFVSNSVQAVDNATGRNSWDVGYASGGNYWSDYQLVFKGVDDCSGPSQNICPRPDGIGDKPYNFTTAQDNYPLINPFVESIVHDIAVSSIKPSALAVNQSEAVSIAVTVKNEGAATENFTLTLYDDHTVIGSKVIQSLSPAASEDIVFVWNTTGVAPGTYSLKAVESTVWGEIDVADNTLVAGPITIEAPSVPSPPTSGTPTQHSSSNDAPIGVEIIAALLIFIVVVALYRRRVRS